MVKDQVFRAQVGDRAFEIEFREGRVYLDGRAVEVSFEPVGAGAFSLLIDGRSLPVFIAAGEAGTLQVEIGHRLRQVRVLDEKALLLERFGLEAGSRAAEREVRAPMPGLVLKVLVEEGQTVKAGDGLMILEAMKMENELRATGEAVVRRIHVAPGEAVGKNALLIELA
ncbi:biotin/lipoyl-binding protein [Rhodocaloribacter litoris]|uniref:biotin/lipoyl-containing protein n=1 Tax=Rhodocaloribacter litoris TaxID=2558931 RepID=UPI00142027CD|nr:acetyl-CoA carboxylase biotin carboxyl carrier protein subunit [Rhodocaloribacter litoris]QXD16687.1 biotin/lipoyl-binding protein [Rhodocaloribacter litoris]